MSGDLAAAAGQGRHVDASQLPNVIMAGPGKAGTTSLFWYLSQHPSICPADVKEIRFFAPITHGTGAIPAVDEYARHFEHCGTQEYRLEASPQYFHGGKPLISAMRQMLVRPRVIITLREPVDRLWSIYRSLKVRRTLPESTTFASYVARCEDVRAKADPLTLENRAYWTISGEFYLDHLRTWLEAFGDDLRIVFFEALADNPAGVVRDICRWLRIDDSIVESFSYTVENQTVANRSRILHRIALAANREGLLRDRRRLKAPLRRAYYRVNRMPQRETMSDETRRQLEQTFAAANSSLAKELRRRGYDDLPDWLQTTTG
jgi:Sulfotransferase domain